MIILLNNLDNKIEKVSEKYWMLVIQHFTFKSSSEISI